MGDKSKVTATAVAVEEPTPESTPDTSTEPTPAPAPAPAPEAPEEPAAVSSIKVLVYDSPMAKRLLDQCEGFERFALSVRTTIHGMLKEENPKGMNEGAHTFFLAFAKATFHFQQLAVNAQEVLAGAIVSDEGEIVKTPWEV